MEFRLTDAFLAAARREPVAAREAVTCVISDSPAIGERRAQPVPKDRFVGVGRSPEGLELRYLVDADFAHSVCKEPPLAALSKAELREAGVPAERIAAVQTARSLAELQALGLPSRVHPRIEDLMLQLRPELRRQADRLTRRARDLEHLEQFLQRNIADLLLDLDASQRRIVELEPKGTVLVRGVAGSGKTAVILHRIEHLLRQPTLFGTPSVLLLAYNKVLAVAVQELLGTLGVSMNSVEVRTLHAWCTQHVYVARATTNELDESLIQSAMQKVCARHRDSTLWNYSIDDFWRKEIHLIKTRVLDGRAQYLELPRIGAGRPLDTARRELVWQVVEELARLQDQQRVTDWDDVLRLGFSKLMSIGDRAPRYDYVFVDEGQDLHPLAFRIIALLARPPGNLLVALDPTQSIYERGFRWKHCGIEVHGSRSFELKANHRSTCEILEAARPLIAALDVMGEDAPDEKLEPAEVSRHGPKPRILRSPAAELRSETLVAAVRKEINAGVPLSNMAVLVRTNHRVSQVVSDLKFANILIQQRGPGGIRLSDESVKVLTMHSAKGLEFPVLL